MASFVSAGHQEVVEQARALAAALASSEGDAVRERTIARALGVARVQMDLVDATLGEALGCGDFAAVRSLTKLADALTRRVRMLLEEHRAERQRDRPVQLLVAHADQVHLGGR